MPVLPADVLLVLAALFAAAVIVVVARRRGSTVRVAPPSNGATRPATGAPPETARLLELADWLDVGLLLVDRDKRVAAANNAAHELLGRSQGSLSGRSTMEAFVDHRIGDLERQSATSGAGELELDRGGEPQRTIRVRARRAGDDGELWLAIADVSELRRLRRIRAEFVDNLSHELRTPVATVRLLTESLAMQLDRADVPPGVREAVLKIEIETGHLAAMVGELLDLARIEQGEAPLRVSNVDLARVVDETLERLRPYAGRQSVELERELPEAAVERIVRGDAERLGQVLFNLVHNAVKFSPPGTPVVVRARAEADEVLLEVEDRGSGIPRAELERIFERFYKGDRSRQRGSGAPRPGGTGLGLAIARHIVERHGGRIWAESREGEGSRFTVALPRRTG